MYTNKTNDKELINAIITLAEDERTIMSKNDMTNVRQVTIDASHTATDKKNQQYARGGGMWGIQSAQRPNVSSIA